MPGHLRHEAHVPWTADPLHHILCRVPRLLIGKRRLEIRSASEEKARESYEYEGHQHRPCGVKPSESCLEMAFVVEHVHPGTEGDDRSPDEEQIEHCRREEPVQQIEGQTDQRDCQGAEIDIAAVPEPVDQHSQAVEPSPDHEIPARAMPQTAQKHGVHPVDVGNQLLPEAFTAGDQNRKNSRQGKHGAENPPVPGQRRGQKAYSQNDRVGPESALAVSSERDVEIVLKPFRQGNMPSLPELGGIAGLVRGVEILRQVKAHQHRHTDCDVSVA